MKKEMTLKLDKETKNCVRYNCADDSAPFREIYMQKFALKGQRPAEIHVTIELPD